MSAFREAAILAAELASAVRAGTRLRGRRRLWRPSRGASSGPARRPACDESERRKLQLTITSPTARPQPAATTGSTGSTSRKCGPPASALDRTRRLPAGAVAEDDAKARRSLSNREAPAGKPLSSLTFVLERTTTAVARGAADRRAAGLTASERASGWQHPPLRLATPTKRMAARTGRCRRRSSAACFPFVQPLRGIRAVQLPRWSYPASSPLSCTRRHRSCPRPPAAPQ